MKYTVLVKIIVDAKTDMEAVSKFYKNCTRDNAEDHDIRIAHGEFDYVLKETKKR